MKKNNGFSLIEIIVVIAILGVLAGLSIPRIVGVMESQKANVAVDQLEQIGTAIQFFSENNKSYSFCVNSDDCDTTDKINGALDLNIHNPDFNYSASWADDLWTIIATREGGPVDYLLSYTLESDGIPTGFTVDVGGEGGGGSGGGEDPLAGCTEEEVEQAILMGIIDPLD